MAAAQMNDSLWIKCPLYIGSAFPAWSRIQDDKHDFSQAALGVWMAYLSTRSVSATEEEEPRVAFAPLLLPEGAGMQIVTFMEKRVSLDQVPAVAKAAIEKETAGGTIKEIEQKQCCGKAAYEVEYRKDGRKVEVMFAEDGTIMTCCKHGDKCQKCGK